MLCDCECMCACVDGWNVGVMCAFSFSLNPPKCCGCMCVEKMLLLRLLPAGGWGDSYEDNLFASSVPAKGELFRFHFEPFKGTWNNWNCFRHPKEIKEKLPVNSQELCASWESAGSGGRERKTEHGFYRRLWLCVNLLSSESIQIK